jgi:hypothetical protein
MLERLVLSARSDVKDEKSVTANRFTDEAELRFSSIRTRRKDCADFRLVKRMYDKYYLLEINSG